MKSKSKRTIVRITGEIIEVTKIESSFYGLQKEKRNYLYHLPKDPAERKLFYEKYEESIQEIIKQ